MGTKGDDQVWFAHTYGRKEEEKPACAVGGMVRPGAMCSKVIVGGKLCGFTGQCEHQRNAGVKGGA
jgi:hypothetical protein